jgi:hypothetical protein
MKEEFPFGIQAQVVSFGENQLHAIEHCLQLTPQRSPTELLTDGDILIAVRAAEIVWTDTVMATGQYQHQPTLPYAPGMTYAGIVVQTTEKARKAGSISLCISICFYFCFCVSFFLFSFL